MVLRSGHSFAVAPSSLGAFFVIAAACADDHPLDSLPTPTNVGDHLRFHSEAEPEAACAGTVGYLDRYAGALKARVGASPELRVDYFHFGDSDSSSKFCSSSAACAYEEGIVVTPLLPHEHELVHAVHGQAYGVSHPFLEEGLAELWGSHRDRPDAVLRSVFEAIEAGSGDNRLSPKWYETSGRFASFLAREFGSTALIGAARAVRRGADASALGRAFERELGATTAELVTQYEQAEWRCGRADWRDDSLNCSVAPHVDCDLADADGTVTIQLDAGCRSENAIGQRDGVTWTEVAFTVPTDRTVSGFYDGPGGTATASGLVLRSCDAGCEDDRWLIPPVQFWQEWPTPEGEALLRLEVDDGAALTAGVLQLRNICD